MKSKSLVIITAVAALVVVSLGGCSGNTKIKTYLAFSASPAALDLKYGKVLAFSGHLRGKGESGLSGKTVLIQSKQGDNCSTLFTLETNKDGYFFKKYHPSAGTYYFRVKFKGDSSHKPCESHKQKVIVE